ncbi:hypothetical protein ACLOJK_040522 [Asimina triloba]
MGGPLIRRDGLADAGRHRSELETLATALLMGFLLAASGRDGFAFADAERCQIWARCFRPPNLGWMKTLDRLRFGVDVIRSSIRQQRWDRRGSPIGAEDEPPLPLPDLKRMKKPPLGRGNGGRCRWSSPDLKKAYPHRRFARFRSTDRRLAG